MFRMLCWGFVLFCVWALLMGYALSEAGPILWQHLLHMVHELKNA